MKRPPRRTGSPTASPSKLLRLTIGAAVVTLATTACAADAGAGSGEGSSDSFTITFSSAVGEGQGVMAGWDWMQSQITERSDGRIRFENHYSASLVSAEDTLAAIGDGRIDAGWVTPVYQPADFPVWAISQIPFQATNPEAVELAINDLLTDDSALRQEFDELGIHSMALFAHGPNVLGTKEPVDSMDDLAGKTIRAGGYSSNVIEAAGGTPVEMAVDQLVEGLQRGTVDGYTQFPFELPAPLGLTADAPYLTDLNVGVYSQSAVAISQNILDEMPEELQDVVAGVEEDFLTEWPQINMDNYAAACEQYQEQGAKFAVLPEGAVAEVRNLVESEIIPIWKEGVAESGRDVSEADALLAEYLELVASHESEATTYRNPFTECGG